MLPHNAASFSIWSFSGRGCACGRLGGIGKGFALSMPKMPATVRNASSKLQFRKCITSPKPFPPPSLLPSFQCVQKNVPFPSLSSYLKRSCPSLHAGQGWCLSRKNLGSMPIALWISGQWYCAAALISLYVGFIFLPPRICP